MTILSHLKHGKFLSENMVSDEWWSSAITIETGWSWYEESLTKPITKGLFNINIFDVLGLNISRILKINLFY